MSEVILEWPTPQSSTDIGSLLGMVISTRRRVKNYAEMTRFLEHLTGKMERR